MQGKKVFFIENEQEPEISMGRVVILKGDQALVYCNDLHSPASISKFISIKNLFNTPEEAVTKKRILSGVLNLPYSRNVTFKLQLTKNLEPNAETLVGKVITCVEHNGSDLVLKFDDNSLMTVNA